MIAFEGLACVSKYALLRFSPCDNEKGRTLARADINVCDDFVSRGNEIKPGTGDEFSALEVDCDLGVD